MKSEPYYDRNGNPIELLEWGRLFEDEKYTIVKEDRIGKYYIKTVWRGHDLDLFNAAKLIFETIAMDEEHPKNGKLSDLPNYKGMYSTEEQAIEGHNQIVEMCKVTAFQRNQNER